MLTTLGRPSGVAGGNILRIKSASDFPALANDPTAANPTDLVTGAAAVPAQGGPAVGNPNLIQQVVQNYLEAQLEAVAGHQSNTLREAR